MIKYLNTKYVAINKTKSNIKNLSPAMNIVISKMKMRKK